MKVSNIETLREETMRALNEEFGLDLVPCEIEITGGNNKVKFDYALTNEFLRKTFSIVFTDDYLFFRYDGKTRSCIEYIDLRNKAQYYVRVAVIVNELLQGD